MSWGIFFRRQVTLTYARIGVRRQKDAGLGDLDEARHDHGPATAHVNQPAAAAAIELLREARKLRAVVEAAATR